MMEHDDEVQGDLIELRESIQSVHEAMTSKIQDGQKGGKMQIADVRGYHSEVKRSI